MNPPNPNQRPTRRIQGPQSALTDFLASHNINANQIRQDADARRAAALASQRAAEASNSNGDDEEEESEPEPVTRGRRKSETKAQLNKRKKEEEKAIAKIKASKQFQRRRKQHFSDEEVSDEDDTARAIFEESMAPLPGQMENCEICEKRFTVTPYSRPGPDGGLLCPQCTKQLDKEEGAARKKRKTNAGRQRRQLQSNLLDGIYPGAKDLVTLCIETLAKNVDQAESFGDLPASLIERLAAILGKRRIMTSSNLDLFLRSGADTVTVFEGAKLSSDDYIRIFQVMPTLKHLTLRNAIQFKNKVMDHLLGTTINLETLSLHGANLIDDERWNRFMTEKASNLKALKVYYTDGHFGDEQLECLAQSCPQLERLKISHNQKVTSGGLAHITQLPSLKHLSLELYNPQPTTPYLTILDSIGSNLRTISLSIIPLLDDTLLTTIHAHCRSLRKLRLTDNALFTDSAFTSLFTSWANPPLYYIDLHKCRHLDSTIPRDNPDNIGLCSSGFTALMSHSGSALRHLNIHSCRHISLSAFESVFALGKTYEEITEIDVSFCQNVNDFVVGCIFKACPKLKTLKVFGCFGVKDVRVPRGRILIGMPNAVGMQIEGTGEEDGEGEGRVI